MSENQFYKPKPLTVEVDGVRATCGYWEAEALARLVGYQHPRSADVTGDDAITAYYEIEINISTNDPDHHGGEIRIRHNLAWSPDEAREHLLMIGPIGLQARLWSDETNGYEYHEVVFTRAVLGEIANEAVRVLAKALAGEVAP